MKSLPIVLAFALLVPFTPGTTAQEEEAPQDAWMLHVDGTAGSLRFVPDRIILVPGGTVQLMVFGQGHGRYSVTLDDAPEFEAEVDTAAPGAVHVAEFAAPTRPGEYPFHDKHHPEAKGLLVVKPAAGSAPASASDATVPPTVGVGNGYDTRFYPDRLEVQAGDPIRFTNNASEIIHTMTAADASFDADAVRPGDERTLTAPATPGEYEFICKYHQDTGMKGALIVRAADASTPTPTAQSSTPTPKPPTATNATPTPQESATDEDAADRDTPGTTIVLLLGAIGLGALAMRSRTRRE